MIHRLSCFRYFCQAGNGEVLALLHETENRNELFEVFILRRPQPILLEERDYDVPQISEPSDAIPIHIFSVIVEPTIHMQPAASEEADKVFQNISTRR
jgi:hypothetical protein